MLPCCKHGKDETKQPTEGTGEVGNSMGPRATVVSEKDTVPSLMGFIVQ